MKLTLTPESCGIGDACSYNELMMAPVLGLQPAETMAKRRVKIVTFYRRIRHFIKTQAK